MSRTFLAIALVLASYTRADDAPLVLAVGERAPFAGVLAPDAFAVDRAQEIKDCRAQIPELRKAVLDKRPLWVDIVVFVGVAAASAAAGYGIAKATQPKP